MRRNLFLPMVLLTFSAITTLHPRPAGAAWPLNGMPVCTASGARQTPEAVSDGAGGAIIVWGDTRNGGVDIYAQRLDGFGVPQWNPDGVQISSGNFAEQNPRLIGDGAGGAVIVWEHAVTDYNIHAQRVDASGNVLWQPNGVVVSAAFLNQQEPRLIPDGTGGAIFTWHDVRSSAWDIYAQRVDGTGALLWTVDGIQVCVQAGDQFRPCISPDGFGGAIIAWEDNRNAFQSDVYAQRVASDGTPYWGAGGVALCTNGLNQLNLRSVGLDIGGAVVVWEDYRTGAFSPSTFAQRVTTNGAWSWAADGIQVCTLGGPEYEPQIVADDDHGVIVAWRDLRVAGGDIYAQRLDAFGTRMWAPTGVQIAGPGEQFSPRMTGDLNGGAFVSWLDFRYDGDGDIFAGHVDANGATPNSNGTAIGVVPGFQFRAPIVSDGEGGAIMAWEDNRTGYPNVDVQRLDRYGNWGYPCAEIVSAKDVPGDQGGLVNLTWTASRLDPWPAQYIDLYTVWRSLDATLALTMLESGTALLSSPGAVEPGMATGIRTEIAAGQVQYWQLVASVDAYHLSSYAFAAPTLFDSTATSPGAHHFQVIAHHQFGNEYWTSAPASGRSIDNLAPAAPLMLVAQRVGSDVQLKWNPSGENEPDFSAYAVYRASSMGVQPVPGSFISDSPDTLLTDVSPPPGFLYYIVTAKDSHGNQSTPSNEAAVAIPTGIEDRGPSLTRLTLGGNFPNPFGATTDLRVGLPRASDIQLEVFDVVGRRVASQAFPRMASGWQSVTFDGRDARGEHLPSGVYFYRITAAGETRTHKMVVGR